MRRRAPRSLRSILPAAIGDAGPQTLLARVQTLWPEVAGPALAAATRPIAEREGVVTVACESSLWAHELDLLQRDLVERLAAALGAAGGGRVEGLRFKVGSLPNHP
jgi:predicted nucleic acid-binding Zn ribbon protein